MFAFLRTIVMNQLRLGGYRSIRQAGLLQSVSQPVWPERAGCALLGEIATFLCSNPQLPQAILT